MRARYHTDPPATQEMQRHRRRMSVQGERPSPPQLEPVAYAPPRVELVLSPEELQQEMFYAGSQIATAPSG
jgi:hypothetical protein